jgi:hypothetical protein
MSKRRLFNPRTVYENERLIRRNQQSFDGGMVTDPEASDVGPNGSISNAVVKLFNTRGFKDGVRGASGSVRFTPASITVTITNNTQTLATALTSGFLYLANNSAALSVGDVFEVMGDGDFTGTNLQTAKGDYPRRHDIFSVVSTTSGSESILYVGNYKVPALEGYGDVSSSELTASKSGVRITKTAGSDFDSTLIGSYWVWLDGTRDYINNFINENTLECVTAGTRTSTAKCKIEPPLNASYNHKSLNKICILAGKNIYVAKNIPITGWVKVTVINSDLPASVFCKFFEDGDDLVLVNPNGTYRIKITSEPYAWKINDLAPHQQLSLNVPSETLINGYRLIYSMGRFKGANYSFDRTNAVDGMVLEQQSAPVEINTHSGIDYSERWLTNTVDTTHPISWSTFEVPAMGSQHWTHFILHRTLNINNDSIAEGNLRDLYIWSQDIPIAKAFNASRSGTGVITATSGIFKTEDIGNVILFENGQQDIIVSIIDGSNAQGSVLSSIAPQSAGIGNGTVFTIKIEGTILTVTSGYLLTDADVRKQIFTSSGKVVVIIKIYNTYTAEVLESDVLEIQGAVINPKSRVVCDNVDDDILRSRIESKKSLYYLQNRFFQPFPDTNIGVIASGFAIVAVSGRNEYFYCNTGKKYLAGAYHSDKMHNDDKIWDGIQQIRPYPDKIIIRCTHSTYRIATTTTIDGGDNTLGESYQILGDPEVVDDAIGSVGDSSAIRLPNGNELVFTNEPAIRIFNGYEYGENLAKYIMNEIKKLKRPVLLSYSPIEGVHLFGQQEI